MCGIVGIVLKNPQATNQSPSKLLRQSISKIQHRGYDGTGIAIGTSKGIKTYKNYGLINNVLADHNITNLNQNHWDGIGLAHTRYRTVGECNLESSQPLTNQKCNLSLVHNGQCKINHSIISAKEWGNLNNIIEKRKYASDSVFLLDIWDQEINRYQANDQPKMLDIIIPKILAKIFKNVRGSYSCLLNIHGYGLVAFRDPLGIRPLVVGETIDGDYYFASEDITFNHCQLKKRFDLLPGSAMVIHQTPGNLDLQVKFYQFRDGKMKIVDKNSYGDNIVAYQPCIFEYIYLAHPTSTINGFLVKNARALLGQTLADQIDRDYDVGSEIDYVIPIPESSCFSASVLARTLNLPYLELLSLNPDRKQARSFILPTQQLRENAVANKFLFPHKIDLKGKSLLLVDDSIIRGTTLKHLIKEIKNRYMGIKKIWVASIAPAVVNRNIYGIDIPNTNRLIAYQRSYQQIANQLGADKVIFQDLNEIKQVFTDFTGIPDWEVSMFVND